MNERSHEGEDPGDLQVREPQSGRWSAGVTISSRPQDETLRKDFT